MIQSDLVVEVRKDSFSIPALRPEERSNSDLIIHGITLCLRTTFPAAVPLGLAGKFVAYFHRIIGNKKTHPDLILVNSLTIATDI